MHGHKNRAKQIKANLLTDPGMYRTVARKEQQRHIQPGRSDSITELDESMARANKVPKPPRTGKVLRERLGAASIEWPPERSTGWGNTARKLGAVEISQMSHTLDKHERRTSSEKHHAKTGTK